MGQVTLWHNPRCSKSRATLELLKEKGVEPKIFEYLKEPVSAAMLKEVLSFLGSPVKDIIRTKEKVYAELGLEKTSGDDLLDALTKNPILIERPIVIKDKKAVLGRPPENVHSLF